MYLLKSLKGNIRASQSKGFVPVHYKVTDTTITCHLGIKHFLALVKKKKELTNYLAHKPAIDLEKDFVIIFERTCLTDFPDLDENLKICRKEDADTGICMQWMFAGEIHLVN